MIGQTQFSNLPLVVKNLLIINGLFFLAKICLESWGISITNLLALHPFQSPDFMPHQFITHMFMHHDFWHLFFNMFTLWMFGKLLENVWGGKRFLIYYIITGLGAMILYTIVQQVQISLLEAKLGVELTQEAFDYLRDGEFQQHLLYKDPNDFENVKNLIPLYSTPVVGASGAVYGLLLAFGMLFPNSLIYLYLAIPVKAKYFVMVIGGLALFSGLSNSTGDNVAHFAHLGGMVFGFILLKIWKKNKNTFY